MITTSRALSILVGFALLGSTFAAGCKPQYVRGSDKEDLDDPAMSMRLDRKDLEGLYDKTVDRLMSSAIVKQWNRQAATGDAPIVALFPVRNNTNQDLALDALLSKFETDLVNRSSAKVISREMQPELLAELKRQQSDAYNQRKIAEYGEQFGAQYFLTGKVYGVREQVRSEKRQQYFLSLQVVNVETGVIEFQSEEGVTKGFVK